jgi:glutamate 5-kinase
VSTAEIESVKGGSDVKVNFGDNDKLSALVASKIEADLLLILTDVEGLYTANPRTDASAKLIPLVEQMTPEIEALAEDPALAAAKQKPRKSEADDGKEQLPAKEVGRGGMKTKLAAASVATQSGCATIIAGGKILGVIDKLFAGEEIGTLFLAKPTPSGKQRWIAFATTVRASLVVNTGARDALTKKKASLLAAGVVEVKGSFERGDVVCICTEDGQEFARGIVNYSSNEARKILGLHSDAIAELVDQRNYDALITRDNIAFIGA